MSDSAAHSSPPHSPGRASTRKLRGTMLVSLAAHVLVALVPVSWWAQTGLVGGGGALGHPEAGGTRGASFVVLPFEAATSPATDKPDRQPTVGAPEPVSSDLGVPVPLDPPPPPEFPTVRTRPAEPRPTPILPEPTPASPPAPADDPPGDGEPAPDPVGDGVVPGTRGDPRGSGGEPNPAPGAGSGEASRDKGRYRPPRMLVGQLPLTPDEAVRLEAPEELGVRLRVDTEGNVDRVEFLDPQPGEELAEAVRRSAMAMRFVPAKLGTRPVEAWFSMTFVFRN